MLSRGGVNESNNFVQILNITAVKCMQKYMPEMQTVEGIELKPLWSRRGKYLAGVFFRTLHLENLPVPAV